MKRASALVFVALLPLLSGCSQASGTPVGTATTQGDSMEIIELPELQPYLTAAVKGDTSITWTPVTPVTSSPAPPSDAAGKAAQAAITSQAPRLASVDYAALSMPAFVTVTAALKLAPGDFTGDKLHVDSTGEVSGTKQWALYSWQGPRFPPLQSRPQVVRWVQVYALYGLSEKRVVRLIASVRGEAGE
jgi:hypothetical protein